MKHTAAAAAESASRCAASPAWPSSFKFALGWQQESGQVVVKYIPLVHLDSFFILFFLHFTATISTTMLLHQQSLDPQLDFTAAREEDTGFTATQ